MKSGILDKVLAPLEAFEVPGHMTHSGEVVRGSLLLWLAPWGDGLEGWIHPEIAQFESDL